MSKTKLRIEDIDWIRIGLWSISVAGIAAFSGAVVDGVLNINYVATTFTVAFVISICSELRKVTENGGNENTSEDNAYADSPLTTTRKGVLGKAKISIAGKLKKRETHIFTIPFID